MPFTPKTDWKDGDKVPAADFNRIEQGIADANNKASITKVDAPVIDITDPPDDENIQAAFDALNQKLKDAGVFND